MKMEKISEKRQNMQSLTKLKDGESVKMVVLISVSVFSFWLSHSSLLSFLHSLNFYLSTFPYKLLTHNIDKNCIFLICNGLLVFLAKFSGLITTLSLSDKPQDDHSYPKNDFSQPDSLSVLETEIEAEVVESKTIESSLDDENVVIKEEETSVVHVDQQQEEEKEEEEDSWSEDEEEVGNGRLSTEELNKKFDEFIRRMKAEIRIEAQQQLIMV